MPKVNSDHPPRKATVTILVNMIFEMVDGFILVDMIFEMVDGLEEEIDLRYMVDDFEVENVKDYYSVVLKWGSP